MSMFIGCPVGAFLWSLRVPGDFGERAGFAVNTSHALPQVFW